MASTRNKNTPGDYYLQQRSFDLAKTYNTYQNSQYGQAYAPAMPCVGIIPSHMPNNTLSLNPIEIESSLFGINSTNLVSPQAPLKAKLKTVPTISYFDRLPVFMPNPLVIEDKQRPFPIG
jgi:hypothetical protein